MIGFILGLLAGTLVMFFLCAFKLNREDRYEDN